MKSKISLYFLPLLFVCGWWYLAFFERNSSLPDDQFPTLQQRTIFSVPEFVSYLSPFSRDEIKTALSGDIVLMTKLMKEWDIDAQILESQGLAGVRKLKRSAFIRAQMIGRQIKEDSKQELKILEKQVSYPVVFDDQGTPFKHTPQAHKFLPQTFISASFLFALATPKEIVAIPNGIRAQTTLYPKSLTDLIPLDTDRVNSERLYKTNPNIAFVADYSHPATLEMLKNQGIPLFTLNAMKTIHQVEDAVIRVGNVVNHPLEAEVLSLFIESAMFAIDNRLIALHHDISKHYETPKVMFLNHYAQYSVPTDRTIAGDLLHRLNHLQFNMIPRQEVNAKLWSYPIDQEQIICANPDSLIIATNDPNHLHNAMDKNPAFDNVSACVNQRVHLIDYTTQAPTQYIVLTYYDIAQALMRY